MHNATGASSESSPEVLAACSCSARSQRLLKGASRGRTCSACREWRAIVLAVAGRKYPKPFPSQPSPSILGVQLQSTRGATTPPLSAQLDRTSALNSLGARIERKRKKPAHYCWSVPPCVFMSKVHGHMSALPCLAHLPRPCPFPPITHHSFTRVRPRGCGSRRAPR